MELHSLTAHELRDRLLKREVSVPEIVSSVLKRIEQVEPKIDSFITLAAEEAIREAETVQKKLDRKEPTGPLAGIPMAIKDNICTKGIRTTCASRMLENFVPPYDATVVSRLKAAGAVMLGKLNMDEFAMGSSTENSYFKKTRNPWNTDRVPGGSSGGPAAAVAAGEAVFALGSDTGGSIRQPASFCGVVGLKPTYGRVSRYGLIAYASSLDQIGPIAKDVEDCVLVMNAISGKDPMDGTSAEGTETDFARSLVNNVKGLRIALPKECFDGQAQECVEKSVLAAVDLLKTLGAEVEEVSMPAFTYALPAYYIIACAEACSNLARYDGIRYGHRAEVYADLADLYIQSRSEGFGPEVKKRIILGTYFLSCGNYEKYYKKALKVRTIVCNEFDRIFDNFDVVITPAVPTTAYRFGERTGFLKMYPDDLFTAVVNMAGLPAMVVPCGRDRDGLPIGLQIIGKAFDEATLIRTAYSLQQNWGYSAGKPEL